MKGSYGLSITSVLTTILLAFFAAPLKRNLVQAAGFPDYLNNARECLINVVRDRVISSTQMAESFRNTLDRIKQRCEQEKVRLDPGDDGSLLCLKITSEEIHRLRKHIEHERSKKLAKQMNVIEVDDMFDDVNGLDQDLRRITSSVLYGDVDLELLLDSEAERDLLNQLDELEDHETEMGWALTPEQKESLKLRAKKVLGELIENELKQLAMAVLSHYTTGGPIMPYATAFVDGVKFKLVEYLMNGLVDMLSALLGRRIQISPDTDLKN